MHTSHSATDHSRMIFQCPLCSSVPTDQRDSFMNDIRFSVKSFEKGDVIVTQGSKCEFLYILVRGEISTEMADEKGDFMKVEQIKAPNPLATGFLFSTDNRSPVSAICKGSCTVVSIPKENVYLLMREYESFMLAFLSYISNKVSFLSEKLRLVSLRTIRAKLAYYLLKESSGESKFRLKIPRKRCPFVQCLPSRVSKGDDGDGSRRHHRCRPSQYSHQGASHASEYDLR